MRDVAYGILQDVWSAWLRRRLARTFAGVERFCLFVGYSRSGHSLVGALLNAHRGAVIAHELDVRTLILGGVARDEIYARIVARARWFHLRGDRSNYAYRVPRQWQGRFTELKAIGDKRGGAVTRCLEEHPDFFARVRTLVGVPLRLVHVVRNPFDNIAAIAIWDRIALDEAMRFYFRHSAVTARLGELCAADELITIRHEDMLRDPKGTLADLCAFLGLETDAGYLDDCASIVFAQPTLTRRKVDWTPALVREVERRIASHPYLGDYGFAIDDDGGLKRTKLG